MSGFSTEALLRWSRLNALLLGLLILLFIVLQATAFFYDVFILFGLSLVAAYLLLGPVDALERRLRWLLSALGWKNKPISFSRPVSVLLMYLVYLLVGLGLVIPIVPTLRSEVHGFREELPRYFQQMEKTFQMDALEGLLPLTAVSEGPTETSPPAQADSQRPPLLSEVGSSLLAKVFNAGTNVMAFLMYVLVGAVLVFYLLTDGATLSTGAIKLLPLSMQAEATRMAHTVHQNLYRFTRGQALMGVVAGLFLYLIYALLQVKYAGFLAFFYGLSSILPVLGPWIGLVPGMLVILFSAHPMDSVVLLCVSGGFYLVKEYYLLPRWLNPEFRLHPVTVLVALMVCLRVTGAPGLLLGFPVAALFQAALHYLHSKETADTPSTNGAGSL